MYTDDSRQRQVYGVNSGLVESLCVKMYTMLG